MDNFTDVSIDLETLDTRSTAAVLAIGVAPFNLTTGVVGSAETSLYVGVKLESALKTGTVSASTLRWWMKQNRAAQDAAFSGSRTIQEALQVLAQYFGTLNCAASELRVWANGPAFDIAILDRLHDKCGYPVPWAYYNVRDYRTVIDLAQRQGYPTPKTPVAHNALADAQKQAAVLCARYKDLCFLSVGTHAGA
jgi:exodeoxyribonuclease VIII